jgi:hypothetical protein
VDVNTPNPESARPPSAHAPNGFGGGEMRPKPTQSEIKTAWGFFGGPTHFLHKPHVIMKYLKYALLAPFAFITLATHLSAADVPQEVLKKKQAYFFKFDTNGDKALSKEEFVEMTRTQFEKSKKDGYQKAGEFRFKNKDANKDNKLTFEEWFAGSES